MNKLFFPLNQVDNAVEDYELFPRPWFETAGTILNFSHEAFLVANLRLIRITKYCKWPTN